MVAKMNRACSALLLALLSFSVYFVITNTDAYSQSTETAASNTADSLLATIRKEAATAEILPLRSILNCRMDRFNYEVTFKRYFPFYQFKTRVENATPEEIRECRNNYLYLNPKEQAYVLTALFIYEKTKRPRRQDWIDARKERYSIKYARDVQVREALGFYVPNYAKDELFSDSPSDVIFHYQPDTTIGNDVWPGWLDYVAEALASDDVVAFPAFKPGQLDQESFVEVSRETAASQGELAQEWIDNLDYCAELIQNNLGITVEDREGEIYPFKRYGEVSKPKTHWETDFTHNYYSYYRGYDKNKPNCDFMERFLKGVEELEKSSSPNKEVMMALREYWFIIQRFNPTFRKFERSSFGGPIGRNTSSQDLTLRDVAQLIIRGRYNYDGDRKYEKRINDLLNHPNSEAE